MRSEADSREHRLIAARDEAQAEIDAAYWAFTRTARGIPPSLAVPDAYRRRNEADRELRDLRRERKTTRSED